MMERARALLLKERYEFEDLCEILELLRGEGGCPWDREQTHESIRENFIEETYEVVEAIDNADSRLLREELGDVLLQVVFHARIEEEAGRFDISDVTGDICKKLILRHPHVFSNVTADTSSQVLINWEKIKNREKRRETVTESLRSIPPALPALMRADKAGEKAAKVGFDFADVAGAEQKIGEETEELRHALREGGEEEIREELGDLLFAVVNCARKLGLSSEQTLNGATEKFIGRFAAMEDSVRAEGRELSEMSAQELNFIWERLKRTNQHRKSAEST